MFIRALVQAALLMVVLLTLGPTAAECLATGAYGWLAAMFGLIFAGAYLGEHLRRRRVTPTPRERA